jgi:hypothetical protein
VVEEWLSFRARRRLWGVCADDGGGLLLEGAVFKNVAFWIAESGRYGAVFNPPECLPRFCSVIFIAAL